MRFRFLVLGFSLLSACTSIPPKREVSSAKIGISKVGPKVNWHFVRTGFKLGYVYTPFFIDGEKITLYSSGPGESPGNGVLKITNRISDPNGGSETQVVTSGPNLEKYNYFRAPRVAKSGSEVWMLTEIAGCYQGCDDANSPKSLATYHSLNDGNSWSFVDYVKIDGKRYVTDWRGHTGLVYNPLGSPTLDLNKPAQNRFISIGDNKDILISADGVNFKALPIQYPFPNDRLVFASIAKTPFGFHLTSCANWSDNYYTTTVRHLFSKDLIHWDPIEFSSVMKNMNFYKGVHLSYDEKSKMLWALSPCGSSDVSCQYLAWLEPRDFSIPDEPKSDTDVIPVGEFIRIGDATAFITGNEKRENRMTYTVRYANGSYDSGFTQDLFTRPLALYEQNGCTTDKGIHYCVGDAVICDGQYGAILGFYDQDKNNIKYAIRFSNGVVDTGYTAQWLSFAK